MKGKRLLTALVIAAMLTVSLCGCREERSADTTEDTSEILADRSRILDKSGEPSAQDAIEASEGTSADSIEAAADTSAQDTTLSRESGDAGDPEDTLDESSSDDILVFRDAYGEEHQTVINRDIAPNTMDNDAILHRGDTLIYTDGDYMLGIDVSHHQREIDWYKVKEAGYDFAMLRIGFRGYGETGKLKKDTMFERNYKAARECDIKVGVYFFAQAINETEAQAEADFVLDILDGRQLDLPVAYDPESILDDEARTDDVSGEQFTQNTQVFCRAIEEAGYQPMIYANMMWEAFELDLTKLSDYPIWYADYELAPQTPYHFDMWQYTNTGIVSGVPGSCDINIYLLDEDKSSDTDT